MTRSVLRVALAIGILTVASLGGAALVAQANAASSAYVVALPGATLSARGVDLIDDYGGFATARLAPAEVSALAADGVAVTPLDHSIARGAVNAPSAAKVAVADGFAAADGTERVVVQFRGPVKAEWRATLDATVEAVYDYLPRDAFVVRASPAAQARLDAMPEVLAVVPYHAAFKLSGELPQSGVVDATVLAFLDEDLQTVLAQLRDAGATPTAHATTRLEHVIDVTVDAAQVSDVARLDAVAWIEPAYDEAGLDNAQASAITQGGSTGAWPVHAKGVDGSSQVLSVCDTGANTNAITNVMGLGLVRMVHEMHDDVGGTGLVQYNAHFVPTKLPIEHQKIALYYSPQENGNRGDSDDSNGHGTHTAGTLAGDKPLYGERNDNDGVAYAAKLAVCDITIGSSFQVLNDYANYWDPAYGVGSRVNSNSWGSSHTNAYTTKARQHDEYVWENRDFLILRSMGNTGSTGSIRPEAVAKSAMGIGATSNGASAENLASFSTGGLTADGRMKPNVVAPGACLTSSYLSSATSYSCLSGTSMSTPATAGAAGLVRDYFQKGFYPSGDANSADSMNPTSALVRAVLQVSGKEISGDRGLSAFPNKAQGWGRVLLEDALFFSGDGRKLIVEDEGMGLSTGEATTFTVTVGAGQPLRVMVAWSDYPGASGANPAIVNDLDLTVTGPDGVRVGNAFVGNEVPVGAAAKDGVNVEEAVYVNAPVAGTYTVTVTAANVPQGPQPFALVVTGDVA